MISVLITSFNIIRFTPFLIFTFILSAADKNLSELNHKENIDFYFPILKEITNGISDSAPLINESKQLIYEAGSNKIIAKSHKGITTNLNVGSHSIYENRPNQSYYQSYRTIASISLRKPLFHWGALDAVERIAELSEKSALQQIESSKIDLILKLKTEFMEILLLHYELKLENDLLNLSKQNEKDLIERKNLGLVTELMVSESSIKKLEQSLKIAELERILTIKKAYFAFDSGYNKKILFEFPKDFETFYKEHEFGENIPQLIGTYSSENIENLKIKINTQKEQLKIANSSLKPKLNLIGGFYQDQIDLPDSPNPLKRNNFLIGIEANWALWDSYRSKGEKSLALAKKRKFEMQIQSSTKRLRLKMNNFREQLINLGKQITVSRQLLSAAKNRFEKHQIEFNKNRKTAKDLFASKLSLTESELYVLKSVFQYMQLNLQYSALIQYPDP